ncbi:hypothetical protein DFH06DRAFT_1145561 [Mycena polygramma]|nr:hypothetical protein DFH06DRAFT_1145561 [Mycena polygramma]
MLSVPNTATVARIWHPFRVHRPQREVVTAPSDDILSLPHLQIHPIELLLVWDIRGVIENFVIRAQASAASRVNGEEDRKKKVTTAVEGSTMKQGGNREKWRWNECEIATHGVNEIESIFTATRKVNGTISPSARRRDCKASRKRTLPGQESENATQSQRWDENQMVWTAAEVGSQTSHPTHKVKEKRRRIRREFGSANALCPGESPKARRKVNVEDENQMVRTGAIWRVQQLYGESTMRVYRTRSRLEKSTHRAKLKTLGLTNLEGYMRSQPNPITLAQAFEADFGYSCSAGDGWDPHLKRMAFDASVAQDLRRRFDPDAEKIPTEISKPFVCTIPFPEGDPRREDLETECSHVNRGAPLDTMIGNSCWLLANPTHPIFNNHPHNLHPARYLLRKMFTMADPTTVARIGDALGTHLPQRQMQCPSDRLVDAIELVIQLADLEILCLPDLHIHPIQLGQRNVRCIFKYLPIRTSVQISLGGFDRCACGQAATVEKKRTICSQYNAGGDRVKLRRRRGHRRIEQVKSENEANERRIEQILREQEQASVRQGLNMTRNFRQCQLPYLVEQVKSDRFAPDAQSQGEMAKNAKTVRETSHPTHKVKEKQRRVRREFGSANALCPGESPKARRKVNVEDVNQMDRIETREIYSPGKVENTWFDGAFLCQGMDLKLRE